MKIAKNLIVIFSLSFRRDFLYSLVRCFYQTELQMTDYELEGFKLLEKIGEGTYGDVYKVEDIHDKKVYAIKFV